MDAKARGNDDDDHRCASGLSSIKKKLDRSVSDVCNNNSSKDGFIFGSWKCRRNSKKTRVDANEDREYATVDYGSIAAAAAQVRRRIKPRPSSVHDQLREQDFWCPRCGSKMEEPRLLPCLHSVCSACVNEFMSKHYYGDDDDEDDDDVDGHHYSRLQQPCGNRASGSSSLKSRRQRLEGCPRCEHPLPRHGSAQPPPHYSLQHRLVMYAVRRRLSQRAICCDACPQEVQATQHCSRCLCNFCDECGALHEHRGSIRPLWQAKRIRRLAVCLEHPAHSLRYHCLACKRATCKECMWTPPGPGRAPGCASRRPSARLAPSWSCCCCARPSANATAPARRRRRRRRLSTSFSRTDGSERRVPRSGGVDRARRRTRARPARGYWSTRGSRGPST